MTVDSTNAYQRTSGDDVTTNFGVPFAIDESAQLIVELVHKITGAVTVQSEATHYVLTIAANKQSATVAMLTPPPATHWCVRRRRGVFTQSTHLLPHGRFPADMTEAAIDRQTKDAQFLREQVARSIRLSDSEEAMPAPLPPLVTLRGKFLGFDNDGRPVGFAGQGGAANLMSFMPAGSGAVSRTVEEKLRERLSVLDFGAKGDGVADDRPAVSLAVAAAVARGGGTVYFPPGTYRFATKLTVVSSNIYLLGSSRSSTWIVGDHQDDIIEIGDGIAAPNFCRVSSMRIDGGTAARTATSNGGQPAGAALRFRNGHTIGADYLQFGLNHYTCMQLDGGPTAFIYRLDELELNAGAYGIRVGAVGGGVQELYVSNTIIDAQREAAVELKHLSGGYFDNVSTLTCERGIVAAPGDGQYVTACFFDKVLADTCNKNGWLLECLHASASITDWNVLNSWAAGSGQTGAGVPGDMSGVRIGGSGLGVISGIVFNTLRASNNRGDGIQYFQGTEIVFANCQVICNSQADFGIGSGSHHGLSIAPGTSGWSVLGGTYGKGGRIGAVTGANLQGFGIVLNGGASNNYSVIGADVRNNVIAGFSDGGAGPNKNVRDNIGYRNSVDMEVAGGTLTTDGNGDLTIAHTLDVTPTRAIAQMNGSSAAYHLQPLRSSFGATTLKVRVYDMAGAAVTGTLMASSISLAAAG